MKDDEVDLRLQVAALRTACDIQARIIARTLAYLDEQEKRHMTPLNRTGVPPMVMVPVDRVRAVLGEASL